MTSHFGSTGARLSVLSLSVLLLAACARQAPPTDAGGQAWAYANSLDSISNQAVYTGCRTSSNAATTSGGQSQLKLCFQQTGDETRAWLELTQNAAFTCAPWPATCQVPVKLDSGEPFELAMTQKSDSPGRLYIVGLRALLTRISNTERLIVSAPIDGKPGQEVGFSLDGLDFNQLHFPADAFQAPAPTEASAPSPSPPAPGQATPGLSPEQASAPEAPISQSAEDRPVAVPAKVVHASAPAAKPVRHAPVAPEDRMGQDPPDHDPGAG